MAKLSNPRLPKLTFQKLITAGSGSSGNFGTISTKGLTADLGLKGGNASVESKAVSFGSPSSKSSSNSSANGPGSASSGLLTNYLSNALGSSVLGAAFSGLSSLFGFGTGSAPAALTRFALPGSESVVGAISAGSGTSSIAGLTANVGRVAATRSLTAIAPAPVSHGGQSQSGPASQGKAGVGGHQFHFHVSAMDTQSFVDRSGDIAKAVRTAMLQSNSLNDVISET